MMNKYMELKSKHEQQVNDFPMTFAFSNKQFEEAKEKLGVKDNKELLSLGSGGLIRKTDNEAYGKLLVGMTKDTTEAVQDDEYLYQGFLYELGNHEYCITGDPEVTLDCFNLTLEEVKNDPRLLWLFVKAKKEYFKYNNA